MEITCFPIEVLQTILILLDFRDLIRCRQICWLFKNIVDSDIRLQYKIELAVAGMEDGPPSALTPTERLTMLRERQEAWRALRWRSRKEYPMLKGGVWELYGGVIAQADGDRTLAFVQLPSDIRRIEEKQWKIEDAGVVIRDFGMDPAQNLLIVVEHHEPDEHTLFIRVHLKSITDGAVHPAAVKGGVLIHTAPRPGDHSYAIQTSEDLLGLLVHDEMEELLVWNWKTGSLLLHVVGEHICSFAFLTSRHVLLTLFSELELDEDTVGQSLTDAQLRVVDLETTSGRQVDVSDLDYLCAFHYPAFADDYRVFNMLIRSDPAPHWRPNPSLNVPFHVSRVDRLFVITITMIRHRFASSLLSLVPSSTLLSLINSLPPKKTRRDFTWTEWGPDGSHFMPAPLMHSGVWVCYVYGMTLVLTYRTRSKLVVITYDFNPLTIRQAQFNPNGVEELARERLVIEESNLNQLACFEDQVCTRLPYLVRRSQPYGGEDAEGGSHFNAAMISEDALVIVSSDFPFRQYHALTF
ncbi:hypothetical protein C8Q74DRAFT_1355564 [Fomes fomentarius]|nr:hypothetical protein C8Q74DRAFT_1355564 [Fomes fomentarius]